MERAELLEVLRDKAVELLEVTPEQVREDATFVDDLDADSLALVELALVLEESLGTELPEQELAAAGTVGSYADVLLAVLDRQQRA